MVKKFKSVRKAKNCDTLYFLINRDTYSKNLTFDNSFQCKTNYNIILGEAVILTRISFIRSLSAVCITGLNRYSKFAEVFWAPCLVCINVGNN